MFTKPEPETKKQQDNNPGYDTQFFQDLFNQAPLPYQSLDLEGKILLVNQAWCDLLGYSLNEVVGRWFGNFIVPSQRELFSISFEQFKRQGVIVNVEFELIRKNGKTVLVSGTGKIATHPNGEFKQTHCILTDLTEQIKSKEALHQSQEFYKALFENNAEVILIINPANGSIIMANTAACAYYGYDLVDITQMQISQINTLSPEEILIEMDRAHRQERNVFSFRHRLASGDVRDVEVFSGPIEVHGAKLLYSIVRDVTDTKMMEKETARLNRAMRERLIALTQPVGDVSRLEFTDLFDLNDIQKIQDAFSAATGIASIITDPSGNPITRPSGFCRLCQDIIRQTPTGLENCIKSDTMLGKPSHAGPVIQPCLSGGLLDAGTSINVGDRHIANWLIGQVWDHTANREQLLDYAHQIGADITVFEAALDEVPRMPYERFEKVSQLSYLLAAQLSKLALQNIQQARVIVEREQANLKLTKINHLYKVVNSINQNKPALPTVDELFQLVCSALMIEGGFPFAWIGLKKPSGNPISIAYRPEKAEDEPDLCLMEVMEFAGEWPSPIGSVLRTQRVYIQNDLNQSSTCAGWVNEAIHNGYQSVIGAPLTIDGPVAGGLVVYSTEKDAFQAQEIHLLEEIALNLSLTLSALEEERRRKVAEKALIYSEERYRRLFSSGNDAVYVYPVDSEGLPGNFVEVNPKACEGLGYSPDELMQMTIWDIYPPEERGNILAIYQRLLEEQSIMSETRHMARSGERIPVEINSNVFQLNGGRYVLTVARNISERKQAEERIQKQLQRLAGLHEIDNAITSKQPLPVLLSIVLDEVIEHLQVMAADILVYQPENQQLVYGQIKGFAGLQLEDLTQPVHEGIADWIMTHQTILVIPKQSKDYQFSRKEILERDFKVYYGAPLISKGKVLGVLEVFLGNDHSIDSDWLKYYTTLAGQTAIAIEVANMNESLILSNQILSHAYDETIEGWSRALDLRDHETEGHSRRVTDLALQMGQRMGFSEETLTHVRRGALLHDIGKMGIPDQILLKPGRLSPEEWDIMKRHPQYAQDLLAPISFLHPSLEIPFCHHEKWDGSGYPRGLKGAEIPLSARIFAIVDVWDALLSDRPYRKGWSTDDARRYILEQTGRHFDPRVVQVFLELINSN